MRRISNSTGSNGNIEISTNTAVKIFYKTKQYAAGSVGTKESWEIFRSSLDSFTLEVFWVDLRGSYGSQQVKAMSLGVYDLCTVRMDYHPTLYRLLQTREVILIKNASAAAIDAAGHPILSNPDVYTLWGAVDDIRNRQKIMEFQVRRYEAK